mgnify:CR=1 FL=1
MGTEKLVRPDVHLCLVSDEAAPNLTPLLDRNTRPKEVVLLYAKETQQYTDWLEQVIKQASGVKVSRWMLQSQWRIEHIQEKVLELLARFEGIFKVGSCYCAKINAVALTLGHGQPVGWRSGLAFAERFLSIHGFRTDIAQHQQIASPGKRVVDRQGGWSPLFQPSFRYLLRRSVCSPQWAKLRTRPLLRTLLTASRSTSPYTHPGSPIGPAAITPVSGNPKSGGP